MMASMRETRTRRRVKKKTERIQTNKEARSLAGRKRRRSRRLVYILFINVYEFSAAVVEGRRRTKDEDAATRRELL